MIEDIDREFPFEFERKFFIDAVPAEVMEHGSRQVIVQSYVFAQGGYAVRVRMTFRDAEITLPPFDEAVDHVGAYERRALQQLLALKLEESSIIATIAVKSPSINGERYEMESELDAAVATQILMRSGRLVLKTRYSLWYHEDGWEFDVFAGQNRGLIIAEIERITPVVDLKIPDFCITEVTADPRFTNDALSKEPWTQWDTMYRQELALRGPFFLDLRSPEEPA
ncbi:MAG: adenylate cyclase [Actinomycetaceae bacterium]|nr:adenylate cyclase [Actinomycetaceae bacterium]